MQIILLSGGSGPRLWPLSNDARSKQFLRLLPGPVEGSAPESMIQRVVRQLTEAYPNWPITVVTNEPQRDSVVSQVGDYVQIVTEPSRRKTFPAVCLACEFLYKIKGCDEGEPVVVMPCDPFTEKDYFSTVKEMIQAVEEGRYELMTMGVRPEYASSKFGYVIPDGDFKGPEKISRVDGFVEKPSHPEAKELIGLGALWNAGVYCFRLGYVLNKAKEYIIADDFDTFRNGFNSLPEISFDREIAERCKSMGVVLFEGKWKDLGTWNTLTEELENHSHGNVITDSHSVNTHVINELNIPVLCLGTRDLVVAASPDGIVVSDKDSSDMVKDYAAGMLARPMYEERRWGVYRVLDNTEMDDGYCALTKQLILNPGASISYQRHNCRDEVWTIVDGEGEIVIDGVRKKIGRGDVVEIKMGQLHALRALTRLILIEVQKGTNLVEQDIERFPYEW